MAISLASRARVLYNRGVLGWVGDCLRGCGTGIVGAEAA
jgi:hypothetical protein